MLKRICVALALVSALALCGAATTVEFITGQHYGAGWVEAVADQDNLTIVIETDNGWVLEETHVYVGTTRPTKSAPGRFPFKHEDLGGATFDIYEISLDGFDVECMGTLYIAVHAVVRSGEFGEETAWGDGPVIRANKNWAMYFTTPVVCEGPK